MSAGHRKQNNRRISKRDRSIIEHVARYRLTTKETLHRLFFDENSPNAVTKVVNRLCEEDWLRKFPLVYPRQYFLPGKRAVQSLGLPAGRSLPLGPQSLPTECAVMLYATASHEVQRLTRDEIAECCDWYEEEWALSAHCLRSDANSKVLELIRVDLGGPSDHVARKCVSDISNRSSSPAFEQAVRESRFRIVVITATTDKAAAIQLSLQGHLWPDGLTFHLAVIPELLSLLPR